MRCHAYTDESGHSGLELFNTNQEAFWTGTLIAFSDVDAKFRTFHRELLGAVGKSELHGNELGFGRIEKIAARLSWFIREKKLYFSFGRVHKPFLAATKMFSLIFDSGTNVAVPPAAYGVRQLRLINTMHFVQLLELDDLKEFWGLFRAQDPKRFSRLLKSVADRVKDAPYDDRSIQILTDALNWGSEHPEKILDPFGEGDSPNFVAFTALFDHLHSLHEQEGHVVGTFVHDEQDQFVPHFTKAYDFLTKFKHDDDPLSLISDIRELPSFDCAFEVRQSSKSFGLQIVDVCMWLMRRVMEYQDKPRGNCRTLFECLLERSWLAKFDFENLARQVKIGAEYVENLPLSEQQLTKGREILKELEEARLARLKDGT